MDIIGATCRQTNTRKGTWTEEEDLLLKAFVEKYGEGKWRHVAARGGLNRCRKSCRLRWLNYLRPNIKRGSFSIDEDDLIIRLHRLLGNRWSLIAGRVPGRTANDIKNYWNSHLSKKLSLEHKSTSSCLLTHLPSPHISVMNSQWLNGGALEDEGALQDDYFIGDQGLEEEQQQKQEKMAVEKNEDDDDEAESERFWRSLLVEVEKVEKECREENSNREMVMGSTSTGDLFDRFEDLMQEGWDAVNEMKN